MSQQVKNRVKDRKGRIERLDRYKEMKLDTPDKVYGVMIAEIDQVGDKREFIAAYGEWKYVQLYKEDFRLKGEVRVYKTKTWLVKRLEKVKETLGDQVEMVYVDPQ